MKIVKGAEEIVQKLVDVELPEWKRRQRLACVGSPVNTTLNHLENWYEQQWPFQASCWGRCFNAQTGWCCVHRFTSVLEMLLELREQLQKLQQQQDKKFNSSAVSEFSAPLEEVEKAAASLCIKLLKKWAAGSETKFLVDFWILMCTFDGGWCLCSALVVEKQPFMSSLPQRPLIVKTGVRFTVSVRCVFLQLTFS